MCIKGLRLPARFSRRSSQQAEPPRSSVETANVSQPIQGASSESPPPRKTLDVEKPQQSTSGMAHSIVKVAVAGPVGNTGPTVIKKLAGAGFEVTALTRSKTNTRSKLTEQGIGEHVNVVEIDYKSHDSLVSGLHGIDAVVVCGVGMLPEQTNLIDAAIAAGVQRFMPADFGADLVPKKNRDSIVNEEKVKTEEYLKARESSISHTSIKTGPLLDFCLRNGVLVNMKQNMQIRFDDGEKRFSTTTISTAADAVVKALKLGEKSSNRAYKIQDFNTTQAHLLELAKEVKPGVEWKVIPLSTAQSEHEANETLKHDPRDRMAMIKMKGVAVFGKDYVSDFGESDDVELSIKMMDDHRIKEILKEFA